jgi:hypothetical protein
MKTILNPNQSEELKKVAEKIVQDIELYHVYDGKLSIERSNPPAGTPSTTPAGYPHLAIYIEKRKKFLGLIPYKKRLMLCAIKEGFYDIQENGRKDVLVLLQSKEVEAIIKKHLEEYGKNNQATDIILKT